MSVIGWVLGGLAVAVGVVCVGLAARYERAVERAVLGQDDDV